MRITPHAIGAAVLVALSVLIAVPIALAAGTERPVPVTKLTVPERVARPVLFTADQALGPIAQVQGQPGGNPFVQRVRGQRSSIAMDAPPPPDLVLPDPPATPFSVPAR